MSESIPINGWLEKKKKKKKTAPLNKKKKKQKNKNASGEDPGENIYCGRCEAETKPLRHCDENNFLFQILPTSFQKKKKINK